MRHLIRCALFLVFLVSALVGAGCAHNEDVHWADDPESGDQQTDTTTIQPPTDGSGDGSDSSGDSGSGDSAEDASETSAPSSAVPSDLPPTAQASAIVHLAG